MVLIPVRDVNPIRHIRFAFVTVGLIVACVAAYLWQLSLGPGVERALLALGAVPAVITGERTLPPALVLVPPGVTLVTSMFLHGGVMHLIGNMAFLWIFGDNVEDAMGHLRFLVFYLLTGVIAGLAHIAMNPDSTVPAVGASGAISGVLGAYLVLHPKAQVLTVFVRVLVTLPAFVVLGLWIGFQLVSAYLDPGREVGGVAWWAHIGGFVAGALLVLVFRRRNPPLRGGGRGPWD